MPSVPLRRSGGFTLLEVMLSIAIIGVLAAAAVPVFGTLITRNDVEVAGQQVASAIRRAEEYAQGMNQDSAWSVAVQSSSVVLYKGTSFATRDTAYDEEVSLPPTISVSGSSDIQFAKFTGLPSVTGSITLTSNANETRVITVNAKGTVDY